jgi:hypothetical protein
LDKVLIHAATKPAQNILIKCQSNTLAHLFSFAVLCNDVLAMKRNAREEWITRLSSTGDNKEWIRYFHYLDVSTSHLIKKRFGETACYRYKR